MPATGRSRQAFTRSDLADEHKIQLARAVSQMLRPLVRLLIRHEFTHAELTELVRQTYVGVAYDDFSIPEQEMTVSRVAVLTGLSRKEVVRLNEALENNEALTKPKPNRAQRVVHGWLSDTEFLDKSGKPKDLPVKQKKSGREFGSFVALVKRYSGDITYGAVLDELNHVGVTAQPDEDTVRLVNSAYVPRKDELEQVRVISTSVTDLFNTALHNMDADDDSTRFQRQVVYSNMPEEAAEEFRQFAADEATPFIEELNKFLSKKAKASKAKSGKKQASGSRSRVGFGIYHFEESEDTKDK